MAFMSVRCYRRLLVFGLSTRLGNMAERMRLLLNGVVIAAGWVP